MPTQPNDNPMLDLALAYAAAGDALIFDCNYKKDAFGRMFWCDYLVGEEARHMEFYVDHLDERLQLRGRYALAALLAAIDAPSADETWALLEKKFHPALVDDIAAITDIRSKLPGRYTVKSDDEKDRYVYVIECTDSELPLCKIGIAKDPDARLRQLLTSSPHSLKIHADIQCQNAMAIEAAAHEHFASRRKNGEWFAIHPYQAIAFIASRTQEAA